MKICIASDLHDDIGNTRPVDWPEADVLIIAGDTANNPVRVIEYINDLSASELYEHIVVVDGNHEHYCNAAVNVTADTTLSVLGNSLNQTAVTFLPTRGAVKIGNLYFVGRNGWYSFDYAGDPIVNRQVWKDELNDDRMIGFSALEQQQPWDRAVEDAAAIRTEIEGVVASDPDARIVVVTHTAPHRDMVTSEPRYLRTNPFFVNQHMADIITDFSANIAMWTHGHTHMRKEKMIDGVYVLANPRGYPTENPSWGPVVIEV